MRKLLRKFRAVDKSIKLANVNPIKLGESIRQYVGDVRNVKCCRDGIILITFTDKG